MRVAVGKVIIRVGEIRMVEDVVEVSSDTERHSLRQLEVLVDGEIGVEEARATIAVPCLVGEGGSRGRELVKGQASAQAIDAVLLRGTEDLSRRIEGRVVGDGQITVDTVNGSPVRAKKFCESVHPPNAPFAYLLLNLNGVCQT